MHGYRVFMLVILTGNLAKVQLKYKRVKRKYHVPKLSGKARA
jgi:hypothetical protein